MNFFKTAAARLTAGILAASMMAIPAFAVSGTVNADGGLRLRNGVGTEAAILSTLPNGAQVEVSGITEEGWFQVNYQGTMGYVSGEYLVMDETEVQELKVVNDPVYGRVTEGPLNVRTTPTMGGERVKQLPAGTVVQIVDTLNGWYEIADGYVSSSYVKIIDASEAVATARTANVGAGAQVVDFAKKYLGSPYMYGGSSPRGFDCSGFVKYVYSNFGITLNRTASAQMSNGTPVSRGELQPGDLVFFKKAGSKASRASHVGLYIGGNQFIHASTSRTGVIISDMNSAYYTTGFVGGRRLL